MILTIAGNGPLGTAILSALEGMGEPCREVEASDPDLFMKALGCRAVVYAPSSDLLSATLSPKPSPERMREVLKACNAPGVKLLVVVQPMGSRYAAELELLVRNGVPYVVVESSPLLPELEASLPGDAAESLWLARGAKANLVLSADLAAAVATALTSDELQGGSMRARCTELDLADALRDAASGRVAVHSVPVLVDRATRAVRGWFGMKDPPLRELCDALARG